MAIEREIKLIADVDLILPDFTDLLPGLTVGPASTLQLGATYYDTPSLSMARSGVTLRSRTGEPGPIWTLKLPATSDGTELSRHEYTFDEPLGAVPLAARQAARAYVRSQRLDPVVRLHTERSQFALELDGDTLATVCDDLVVSDGGTEPVGSFREIEVEFAAGLVKRKTVEAIRSCLRGTGCRDDETPVPKAVRALGPRAFEPPDVVVTSIDKRVTTRMLIRHVIATSVRPLIDRYTGVWIGDDPEELHQFRVAARRLRSDLRTFAPLLDHNSTMWLRDELSWLGDEVGRGRDTDVMTARLRTHMARLPADDAASVDRLLLRLADTADEARGHVVEALASDRFILLLEALIVAASEPRFATEPSGLAEQAAKPLVIDLIDKPWRRLSRAVDALEPDSPDAALHAVRIRAKRARYAVEAVAPLYGADARRLAKRIADVQSVLGDHQDTTVAEAWLRQAAKAVPSVRLVVGELIALERLDRARLREQFQAVWQRASRPKLRKWLD
ncbi:MAG TPA: CYTH and CHAD domain-containing protein [Ilumatobacteraceae bacterium]|nr:CYTH and CHAD domain-containing protein [Ilumatobacteraceae bacterium]